MDRICPKCTAIYDSNKAHRCPADGYVTYPFRNKDVEDPPMTMKEIEERKEERTSEFEMKLAEDLAVHKQSELQVRQQNHYTRFKIQPVVFIAENNLDFLTGNIIKYVLRHDAKDGVKDLEKAKHYLDMLIQKTRGETVQP